MSVAPWDELCRRQSRVFACHTHTGEQCSPPLVFTWHKSKDIKDIFNSWHTGRARFTDKHRERRREREREKVWSSLISTLLIGYLAVKLKHLDLSPCLVCTRIIITKHWAACISDKVSQFKRGVQLGSLSKCQWRLAKILMDSITFFPYHQHSIL